MKTEKNILIAFILNLSFAIFEFFGGIFTGSVAIVSDAIHDVGDATSIGISYFLEKKSKKKPDEKYTYGYLRYSVIGSVITTLILLVGSVIVIINASENNETVAFNPDEYCIGALRDTFTREEIAFDGCFTMELAPLSYRLLYPERKNNICTKIKN